jgi:hypothetical protein
MTEGTTYADGIKTLGDKIVGRRCSKRSSSTTKDTYGIDPPCG